MVLSGGGVGGRGCGRRLESLRGGEEVGEEEEEEEGESTASFNLRLT